MSWTEEITAKLEPWAQRTIDNLPTDRRRMALNFLQCLDDERATPATLNHYTAAIRTLNGGGLYKRLKEADIRAWARGLDAHYAPETAWLYKHDVKLFLRWIHTKRLYGDGYPPCVSWLKAPRGRKKLGYEILSPTEVKRFIDVARGQRFRAMFFVLYESGARASELVGMKIKDVEFDQYGAILMIGRGPNAKTGERRVRLFESVPDFQLWLSMHPDKDNSEAPLWPSQVRRGQPICRRALCASVIEYAKRAGMSKRITPHTFRHSRATHLATVLTEAQMREFFGWSKDSKMPSIYVHLSGRDVDQTLFEHYGIKPREDGNEDSPLKKKVCPRCNIENSASARFCWRCWAAFDTAKADDMTAQALEILMGMVDPAQFRKKLKEKGLVQEIAELARGENNSV